MRKVDIIAAGVVIATCVFFLAESLAMEFYTEDGVPGPGFFPTLVLLLMIGCAVWLVGSRLAKKEEDLPAFERPTRSQFQRSFGAWLALFGSVLLTTLVGFVPAMFVLVAILLLVIERRRTLGTVATIVLTPLLAYFLFGWLLQVRLPTGLLGE
jgi:hypothetical protein